MSYKLILTREERKAIDWIGDRYSNGDAFYKLLMNSDVKWLKSPEDPDLSWDDDTDITFIVPEVLAWQIADKLAEDDSFCPCFSDELKQKLQVFLDSIV